MKSRLLGILSNSDNGRASLSLMRKVLFSGILLSTMTPAQAVFLYGNATGTSGDIYRIDTDTQTQTLVAATSATATRNLNGNGLDINGRFYFSTWNGPSLASELYFNDLGGTESLAGDLIGHVAGATIYAGSYWYIDDNTDDLMKVTLDTNGLVVSENKIADITNNTNTFQFGDFVFNNTGVLIGSATGDGGVSFFTYFNNVFNEVDSGGSVLQLAFGGDGVLYGQDASNGSIYSVDPLTGNRTPLFTLSNGLKLTDLAAPDLVPVPPAIWLFGSGLLGLIGMSRRKIAA